MIKLKLLKKVGALMTIVLVAFLGGYMDNVFLYQQNISCPIL